MKLFIQIPCYNEEATLPLVFEDMPQHIPGIDSIEYQIVDDGSTDRTVEIAKSLGVHHIVSICGRNRRWLGRAFAAGVDHALACGADILVNTDGDNQYPSAAIAELVRPIVQGKADIVIGDRHTESFDEFSSTKKKLQQLGSQAVALASGEPVPDAVSGFRAYSREALLKIHILTDYTYTVDTLIQAHKKGLEVAWIDIKPNLKTRDSRLIKSIAHKVFKSGSNILRLATVYSPFKIFAYCSLLFSLPAVYYIIRFLYFYFFVPGSSSGHLHSLILSAAFLVLGLQFLLFGTIGELLAVNRRLLEDMLTRLRRLELASHDVESSDSSRHKTAKVVGLQ